MLKFFVYLNLCQQALGLMYLQAEDADRREKNLEEAKKITIEEDSSLPKPIRVCGVCP